MNDTVKAKLPKSSHLVRSIGVYLAVLLFVFLLGYIPMWLKAHEYATNLASTQLELRLLKIQNTLSSAVIDARLGEYEPARQAASDFFTFLNGEVEKTSDSALTQPQKESAKPLFSGRDELITLLARSDPAAADRLTDLYVIYRRIMGGK